MASNSSNLFATKPELETPFPNFPTMWECPITGLKVPKVPAENLQWRAKIMAAAETDEGLQRELYTACSKSILFWINAFVMTYRVFEEGEVAGELVQAEQSDVPFVTWPVQDKHIKKIEWSIDSAKDLLTDKTREMGATWDHVAAIHHQWQFHGERWLFLEMSRVEKDVDEAGNLKCLFSKHDYINRWQPEWLLPGIQRRKLNIVNLDTENRIYGESSNKAAGSGSRVRAVLLDEFAKMDNAYSIKSSIRDVSRCLLPNSTPWGAGTAFSTWRLSGRIPVFDLPWWEHPEKGRDRYTVQDDITGKWEIRSPWFDKQVEERDPKEVAQEINRDHVGSGDTYFDTHVVEEHRRMFGRPEDHRRTIRFKDDIAPSAYPSIIGRSQRDRVDVRAGGDWRIWGGLPEGRPDQTKNYIIGCDPSKGMGASNSVASILCAETREKIAEYACKTVPPHEFARLVCAAALWVGGARKNGRPVIIWESNGDPGINFGREIAEILRYPFMWFDRPVGTVRDRRGKRYGWHSDGDKKLDALGLYRRALSTSGIINHSREALDEAVTFIHYPDGSGVGPAEWFNEKSNFRKNHGDRVIADMLCLVGLKDAPPPLKSEQKRPERSIGYRMDKWRQNRTRAQKNKRFDFQRT